MQKIISFLIVVLFVLGNKFPTIKSFSAYGGSALALVYLGATLGAYISSMVVKTHSAGYLPAGVGFFSGALLGLIASYWLGKFVLMNDWAYVMLGIICWALLFWLKPLV